MAKNIIFCADGTWNGPGEGEDAPTARVTNVFKLFSNLAGVDTPDTVLLAKEQERSLTAGGSLRQIAKYLHGVGDSQNPIVKLLGGTMGAGLIERIVRGYTFISRNYSVGDKIFINGFSRGAYTARALAGLIAAKGLLDASKIDLTDKANAYKLGSAVWYDYRRPPLEANTNWLGRLEETVTDLPGFFRKPPDNNQLIAAPIEAVAVWDTVGALGIPDFTRNMMRADLFRFADQKLSANAKHGIHAVAVDERRADFTPTFWDTDPRVKQTLFPGSHSDVGGGYPTTGGESGLSDRTLQWMTAELAALNVFFLAPPSYVANPIATGPAHQPWNNIPWLGCAQAQRTFPSGLGLSQYVLDRMNAGSVCAEPGTTPLPYRPANLTSYVVGTNTAPGVVVV